MKRSTAERSTRIRERAHLATGIADRLADIACFEGGQLVRLTLDRVRESPHEVRAIPRRQGTPGRVSGFGAGHRPVGVLDTGFGNLGQNLLGRWLDHLHLPKQ